MRLSISSSLLAAVTLATAGEASIFSSRSLSATPKWFSGVQKVARNNNAQLSERATVIRGGAAPGEETAEEAHAEVLDTVEAQDLYLPGLLDTMITRTNKVCSVVSSRTHRLSPRMSFPSCSPSYSLLNSLILSTHRLQQVHPTLPLLSLLPKPKN